MRTDGAGALRIGDAGREVTLCGWVHRRRDYVVGALQRLGLPAPVAPDGAFYAYADCSRHSANSWDFCFDLMQRAQVAQAQPGFLDGLLQGMPGGMPALWGPAEQTQAVQAAQDWLMQNPGVVTPYDKTFGALLASPLMLSSSLADMAFGGGEAPASPGPSMPPGIVDQQFADRYGPALQRAQEPTEIGLGPAPGALPGMPRMDEKSFPKSWPRTV